MKCFTVSKWRANNRFLLRVILILAKIWRKKTLLQKKKKKKDFQWNLAKVEEYE